MKVIEEVTNVVTVRESAGVVVKSTPGARVIVRDGARLKVVNVAPRVEVKAPVIPVVENPGASVLTPPLAMSYDEDGRLSGVDFSGGQLTLEYDEESRLQRVVNTKAETVRTLSYDEEGRLSTVLEQ